jgi:hypothetical protein
MAFVDPPSPLALCHVRGMLHQLLHIRVYALKGRWNM